MSKAAGSTGPLIRTIIPTLTRAPFSECPERPIGTYVEIGLSRGATFNLISPFCRRAVGVDIRVQWKRLHKTENVELHEMSSEEFGKQWTDPIDILFIDGDHRYEVVKRDFDLLAPHVVPCTGIIFLHDTYPTRQYATHVRPSVKKERIRWGWLPEQIRRSPEYADYEIVTLPLWHVGLSIVRRAPQHMEWSCDGSTRPRIGDA